MTDEPQNRPSDAQYAFNKAVERIIDGIVIVLTDYRGRVKESHVPALTKDLDDLKDALNRLDRGESR